MTTLQKAHPQTGPKTPEGKARSRRNAVKHGLTGSAQNLPPDLAELYEAQAESYRDVFLPSNPVEADLVRQLALAAVRRTRCQFMIVAMVDHFRAQALNNWNLQSVLAALALAAKLPDDPVATVLQLECSQAGRNWLLHRLHVLSHNPSAWTTADLDHALDLLVIPHSLRHLDPTALDLARLHHIAANPEADPPARDSACAHIRQYLDDSVSHLESLPPDTDDESRRNLVANELWFDDRPELNRLRRYEAAADREFNRCWKRLEPTLASAPQRRKQQQAQPVYKTKPPILPAFEITPPAPTYPVSASNVNPVFATSDPELESIPNPQPASTLPPDPRPKPHMNRRERRRQRQLASRRGTAPA